MAIMDRLPGLNGRAACHVFARVMQSIMPFSRLCDNPVRVKYAILSRIDRYSSQDKFGVYSPLGVVAITTSEQLAPTEQPTSIATGAVPFGPIRTPTPGPIAAPQLVETTSTLQIGAKLANGNYAFKASNSTYFVSVRGSAAETFLKVKRSDLVTVVPTPSALPSQRF